MSPLPARHRQCCRAVTPKPQHSLDNTRAPTLRIISDQIHLQPRKMRQTKYHMHGSDSICGCCFHSATLLSLQNAIQLRCIPDRNYPTRVPGRGAAIPKCDGHQISGCQHHAGYCAHVNVMILSQQRVASTRNSSLPVPLPTQFRCSISFVKT